MSLKQLFFWFVFVALLASMWSLLGLPDEATLKVWLLDWLRIYGVWFVFFGALAESLLLIRFYFPGSLLIFLAVASAEGPLAAVTMVTAVSCGVLCGYSINYILGRFGWYRLLVKVGLKENIEKAKSRVIDNDWGYVLSTYWHPGMASITATASGIVSLPVKRFLLLSIGGVVLWNTFWGLLVYHLGDAALSLVSIKTVLVVLLGVIVVLFLYRRYQAYQTHPK